MRGFVTGSGKPSINQLVNHSRKILLVQRTGWGKSVVYFISARILRDQKRGPTIIIHRCLPLCVIKLKRPRESVSAL